jgi:superfamily I DNA/RNA helicase
MLIEVRDLLRENKWLKMFRNRYDYIFIDEYQDTSTIQLQTLLSLNAKYYYMIGDRNQSIYGYSGANCAKLEQMLKKRRDVTEMSLSVNFRSDKSIVENSNKYSSLEAVANSEEEGSVDKKVMLKLDELVELMKQPGEIVVLVRTNAVIRKLEKEFLKRKVAMRYFNFINDADVKKFKSQDIDINLRRKLNNFKGHFENDAQVIAFIEQFKKSKKLVTTIHKSKGREFDECVVVNSIAPDVLKDCGIYKHLGKKRLERVSFTGKDEESRNIHYVAVSRAKHKVYFMIYE